MIVHFADRQLNIICSAGTVNPQGLHIIDDEITDDINTGLMAATITLVATDEIRNAAAAGSYMLVGGKAWHLFGILSVEYDNNAETLTVYGEDAGADLINRQVGAFQPTSTVTLSSVISSIIGTSSETVIDYYVSPNKTKGASYFDYADEDTALSRLQSIVNIFGCEYWFDYQLDGRKIERHLIIAEAVKTPPVHDFHYGVDVERITETQSVADVATRLRLYGKDKQPLSKLKGFSTYDGVTITPSDTRFSGSRKYTYKVSGNTVTCTNVNWSTALNPSGIIERRKSTEYNDAKTLIAYAMRELEKIVDTAYSYTVDFAGECNVNAGDYIRIIDELGKLYLESRIVTLTVSESKKEWSAELGYYKTLESSKAEAISITADVDLAVLSLSSTAGLIGRGNLDTTIVATLYRNNAVITSSAELAEGEQLVWYEDGEIIDDERIDDFSLQVSISEGHTYSCELITAGGGDDE